MLAQWRTMIGSCKTVLGACMQKYVLELRQIMRRKFSARI